MSGGVFLSWSLVGQRSHRKKANRNRYPGSVLETLVKRSRLFPYKNVHYYLFAKTGFTKGCADRAKEMGNVTLVRYEDIVDNI